MKSKEEWLKFVVRFAQLDLLNLRKGDRLNLEDELTEFFIENRLIANSWSLSLFSKAPDGHVFTWPESIVVNQPSLEELSQLQQCCLDVLQTIPQDEFGSGFPPTIKLEVRFGFRWLGEHPVATLTGGHREILLLRLYSLLDDPATTRIKRCDECNAFFYREHAAMRCCSKRCAGRNYMRYYQELKQGQAADSEVNPPKRRRGRPRLNPDAKPRIVSQTEEQITEAKFNKTEENIVNKVKKANKPKKAKKGKTWHEDQSS